MQYEKPIMEIIKIQMNDIVCISDGGYDDDDGGIQSVNDDGGFAS